MKFVMIKFMIVLRNFDKNFVEISLEVNEEIETIVRATLLSFLYVIGNMEKLNKKIIRKQKARQLFFQQQF
jgi:hypothetical protein